MFQLHLERKRRVKIYRGRCGKEEKPRCIVGMLCWGGRKEGEEDRRR